MKLTSVIFVRPVEGPDGRPIERLSPDAAAVLSDGVVRVGVRCYPLGMVSSYDIDGCPICGKPRPETAKGETCGSKQCAAVLRHRRAK